MLLVGCAGAEVSRIQVDRVELEREKEFQKELALESNFLYQTRLHNLSHKILKDSSSLCKRTSKKFGIIFNSLYLYDEEYFNSAIKLFSIDNDLTIVAIAEASAAEEAELQIGDKVIAINYEPVPIDKGEFLAFYRDIENIIGDYDVVPLTIIRRGENDTIETFEVDIIPDDVCDYDVLLGQSDNVNAYADGSNIIIEKGMMRFARTDEELGLVIGHELAHNVMGHLDKRFNNRLAGTFLDVLAAGYGVNTYGAFGDAGAVAFSQDFEAEADYVGLHYLHNAGFNTDGASLFWRRMAAEYPSAIRTNHTATHPSTTERFLAIRTVEKEIRDGGNPLYLASIPVKQDDALKVKPKLKLVIDRTRTNKTIKNKNGVPDNCRRMASGAYTCK